MTKAQILEQLWADLDENIEKAVPIAEQIRNAKATNSDSTMLEIQKYKEAGMAPGLAQAIARICPDDFEDYKAVVRHAQARYKAKTTERSIETPGLSGAPGASTRSATTTAPAPATASAPEETSAKTTSTPKRKPAAAVRPQMDPGPDRNDPSQTRDLPPAVAEALARAEKRVASQRKDDSDEAQAMNHQQDLVVPDEESDLPADEINRQLAALEDA